MEHHPAIRYRRWASDDLHPLVLEQDPNWDGTYITPKDPASDETEGESVAIIEFGRCRAFAFGPPNDEALRCHRPCGKGLDSYTAHVVVNSRWIAGLPSSATAHHSKEQFIGLTHHTFTFHDETFECIARARNRRAERRSLSLHHLFKVRAPCPHDPKMTAHLRSDGHADPPSPREVRGRSVNTGKHRSSAVNKDRRSTSVF